MGCLIDEVGIEVHFKFFRFFWLWFHMTFIYLLRAASVVFFLIKLKLNTSGRPCLNVNIAFIAQLNTRLRS